MTKHDRQLTRKIKRFGHGMSAIQNELLLREIKEAKNERWTFQLIDLSPSFKSLRTTVMRKTLYCSMKRT